MALHSVQDTRVGSCIDREDTHITCNLRYAALVLPGPARTMVKNSVFSA